MVGRQVAPVAILKGGIHFPARNPNADRAGVDVIGGEHVM